MFSVNYKRLAFILRISASIKGNEDGDTVVRILNTLWVERAAI
jgi:hypothetical protein